MRRFPKLSAVSRIIRRYAPKRKRNRVLVYGGLVGLLLIIGAVRYLEAPSSGHQVAVIDKSFKATPKAKQPSASAPLENQYFSLSLPPGFNEQAPITPPAGILFSQIVTKPSSFGSLIINIAIQTLPDGGLSGNSGYQLRKSSTTRYIESSTTLDGNAIPIFSDTQSAAVAAFWAHGANLATISVSSGLDNPAANDNSEELAILNSFLQAWQWH